MHADREATKITVNCTSDVERRAFLLHMYDQLFNDINRHLTVIWQSVGVLLGAFAVFSLVEKGILSFDLAAAPRGASQPLAGGPCSGCISVVQPKPSYYRQY